MADHSRNSRRYSYEAKGRHKGPQMVVDAQLDQVLGPRPHPYVIFRMGMDACAKCQRPRSEHQ